MDERPIHVGMIRDAGAQGLDGGTRPRGGAELDLLALQLEGHAGLLLCEVEERAVSPLEGSTRDVADLVLGRARQTLEAAPGECRRPSNLGRWTEAARVDTSVQGPFRPSVNSPHGLSCDEPMDHRAERHRGTRRRAGHRISSRKERKHPCFVPESPKSPRSPPSSSPRLSPPR
ncbi:DUF6415 family natural product biosynthesis protein [Streptomyces sp. NBC_00358]|uniref:DUF6415 family natural product biosynthesis protein n=1 Tax=Streptomyces sp. NBC_00358 TaxID=2975725 RepID=UPI003FA6B37B